RGRPMWDKCRADPTAVFLREVGHGERLVLRQPPHALDLPVDRPAALALRGPRAELLVLRTHRFPGDVPAECSLPSNDRFADWSVLVQRLVEIDGRTLIDASLPEEFCVHRPEDGGRRPILRETVEVHLRHRSKESSRWSLSHC